MNQHIEKIRSLIMNNPYKKHLKYLDGESSNGIEHLHKHAIYKEKYNEYDTNAVKSVPP